MARLPQHQLEDGPTASHGHARMNKEQGAVVASLLGVEAVVLQYKVKEHGERRAVGEVGGAA